MSALSVTTRRMEHRPAKVDVTAAKSKPIVSRNTQTFSSIQASGSQIAPVVAQTLLKINRRVLDVAAAVAAAAFVCDELDRSVAEFKLALTACCCVAATSRGYTRNTGDNKEL